MKHEQPRWTPEQEAILVKEWPGYHSREAVLDMVNRVGPKHTLNAVNIYATKVLGLKRRRPTAIKWATRGTINPLMRSKAVEQPKHETTTVIRDGQKITICPPGYAWGAYRADRPHVREFGTNGSIAATTRTN